MQHSSNLEKISIKIQQVKQNYIQPKKFKSSTYIPGQNNGKWSDEEQMKYIAFIDFYKDKMRSKQKRKSNQFYNEMSQFLGSRNGLQCRSHHQKLEEKYISTIKIITAFKQKFDSDEYKRLLIKLKKVKIDKIQSIDKLTTEDSMSAQIKVTKYAQVQTDLQGLHLNFLWNSQNNIFCYPYPTGMVWDQFHFFYPQNYYFPSNQ